MKRSVHLLTALALGLPLAALASDPPLRVVDSVDLTRYAGRWYEAARLPNKFQDHCAADIVVHYALRADGRIDVVNQCRTAEDKVDSARGIARKAGDGKSNARLEVRFAPAILSFLSSVWGDYWIIGLGPTTPGPSSERRAASTCGFFEDAGDERVELRRGRSRSPRATDST